jgi:hypothetical protein
MGLSSELKGVLEQEAWTSSKGGKITLTEPDAGMRVEVTRAAPSVVALNMNKMGHLGSIRRGKDNQKKCDYMLASKSNARELVVLVELKKTLRDGTEAKEQLRRSMPLLEYLRSFCEVHYERSRTELEVRHFIIAEKDGRYIDKQSVRTTPEKRLKEEEYKGIRVGTYFGLRISFAALSDQ